MGVTAINGVSITPASATSSSLASGIQTVATATNTSFYPIFSSVNGGSTSPFTDANLTYNPAVNTLITSQFQGSLTGTASWASNAVSSSRALTASRAEQVNTINSSTNAIFYPTFVDSANGAADRETVYTNGTFTFNPSTQEFRAGPMNQGTTSNKTNTADADLTINASLTQSMYWVASLTTTRRLIVSNLTQGRSVRAYIRNTNATARAIQFSGSTATTYSGINMAVNAGAASVTQQTIAGSSGTMLVWMENIGGFIVGGVM